MVSKPQIKQIINQWLVKQLEQYEKRMTTFDLGINAKQKDVTKAKEEIRRRIEKLNGSNEVQSKELPEETQE